MGVITSQNAAQAIVKLVAMQALSMLEGTLLMGALVNRNFEPAFAQQGDVINVPIPPVMTARNLQEGGTIVNDSATLGNAQIALNTHAYCAFQVPDITRILVQHDLLSMFMASAIQGLAERIETDIMKCYPLLSDNALIGGAAAIDEGKIDDAETALFNARVPQAEPKFLIVNAATYSDIRSIPKFSEADKIGLPATPAIQEGVVGRLKGFTIARSHFIQTTAGPLAHNIAFARDAFALVTRRLPQPPPGMGVIVEYAEKGSFGMRVVMSYAHGTLGTQVTVDTLYGASTLRPSFGQQITTNT